MNLSAIVTVPPYADFVAEVAAHPLVSGLRLNTVMPLAEPPGPVLERLAGFGQPLWVDLKARQLRVVGAAIPPFTEVRVSHRLTVDTPCYAYFNDGRERARVVAVDGDRLILADGPRRLVGPGESVNIVDPSLDIEGLLTPTDECYLAAMSELGLRRVMLSFAQSGQDVAAVRERLPEAEVVLKLESLAGLELARREGAVHGRLMAARGDLFVEVMRPHRILSALKTVLAADPTAMVASRLFGSLASDPVPSAADISDAAYLIELGYRTFMLGDEVCLRRDTVLAALNLLEEVTREVLACASPSPRLIAV